MYTLSKIYNSIASELERVTQYVLGDFAGSVTQQNDAAPRAQQTSNTQIISVDAPLSKRNIGIRDCLIPDVVQQFFTTLSLRDILNFRKACSAFSLGILNTCKTYASFPEKSFFVRLPISCIKNECDQKAFAISHKRDHIIEIECHEELQTLLNLLLSSDTIFPNIHALDLEQVKFKESHTLCQSLLQIIQQTFPNLTFLALPDQPCNPIDKELMINHNLIKKLTLGHLRKIPNCTIPNLQSLKFYNYNGAYNANLSLLITVNETNTSFLYLKYICISMGIPSLLEISNLPSLVKFDCNGCILALLTISHCPELTEIYLHALNKSDSDNSYGALVLNNLKSLAYFKLKYILHQSVTISIEDSLFDQLVVFNYVRASSAFLSAHPNFPKPFDRSKEI